LAKIERPIGVVLIAVANLPIYIAVLAYVINLYFTAHSYYGSGYNELIFSTYAGVTYSVAGIIGVLCLLVRWKSFRYQAISGWVVECVIFSIIGFFGGWSKNYFDSSYLIIYNYQVIFIAVSIILFKSISIAYFATKKTQASARNGLDP
jgi:hypothetical protein